MNSWQPRKLVMAWSLESSASHSLATVLPIGPRFECFKNTSRRIAVKGASDCLSSTGFKIRCCFLPASSHATPTRPVLTAQLCVSALPSCPQGGLANAWTFRALSAAGHSYFYSVRVYSFQCGLIPALTQIWIAKGLLSQRIKGNVD